MPEDNTRPSCNDLPGTPVPGQEDVYAWVPPMPSDDQLTVWPASWESAVDAQHAGTELLEGIPPVPDASPLPSESSVAMPHPVEALEPPWPQVFHDAVFDATPAAEVSYLPPIGAPWFDPRDGLLADERKVGVGQENQEDDVRKLQEALKKLGYDPGDIDGKWGRKTRAALDKFKKDNGLEEDGIADEETWKAINDALARLEADKPAKPGDVEKVKALNEFLKELKDDMTEEQKKKYKELEKDKIDKLLKELEDALKKWGQSADGDGASEGSIIAAEDKEKWNTEDNVEWLAKVIMSEASVGNKAERTAVGYVVLNRMKRNKKSRVEEVIKPRKFAFNQNPTPEVKQLARDILKCTIADNTGGATHFYSPRSMPMEGDESAPEDSKERDRYDKSDTGGGLEQVGDLPKKNYKPGWAGEGKYPEVKVDGTEPKKFKFHKQPGSGPVS